VFSYYRRCSLVKQGGCGAWTHPWLLRAWLPAAIKEEEEEEEEVVVVVVLVVVMVVEFVTAVGEARRMSQRLWRLGCGV